MDMKECGSVGYHRPDGKRAAVQLQRGTRAPRYITCRVKADFGVSSQRTTFSVRRARHAVWMRVCASQLARARAISMR